jgi:hypothetical protein
MCTLNLKLTYIAHYPYQINAFPLAPLEISAPKNDKSREKWSGLVRVKSVYPDHEMPVFAGPVRVVRVVRGIFTISHMRVDRIYIFFS